MKPQIKSMLMFLGVLPFAVFAAGSEPRWSYAGKDGPATWGRLHKDYASCGVGRYQSPINITTTVKEVLPAIEFSYQPSALRMLNDGHTIQVNVDAGSRIKVGDDSYELQQFHVHTPSEEKIQGKSFDMVIHLVHRNDAGQLAVVAVLFRQGIKENAALQPLWRHMPTTPAPERSVEGLKVDAAGFLPVKRGYYTFEGSITTPPCREGVRWFVLKEPMEMSKPQLFRLRAIFHNNARPVQPLHGRVVKESR